MKTCLAVTVLDDVLIMSDSADSGKLSEANFRGVASEAGTTKYPSIAALTIPNISRTGRIPFQPKMLRRGLARTTPIRAKAIPTPALCISTRSLHASAIRRVASAVQDEDTIKHHPPVVKPRETYNFLDNQFTRSKTNRWIDLHDPATNNLVTRVPETTEEEMRAAVDSAERAFKTWKNTSLLSRQQVMFRLASLIRENMDRLAALITLEQVRP